MKGIVGPLINICLLFYSIGLGLEALAVVVGWHMPSPQHLAWCALSGASAGIYALVNVNQ